MTLPTLPILHTAIIPGSLIGSAAIAFETLSTKLLTKKDKAKCISIINNAVRNLAWAHGRQPITGTIISISKVLDVVTDDITYRVLYSKETEVEL